METNVTISHSESWLIKQSDRQENLLPGDFTYTGVANRPTSFNKFIEEY